MFDVLIMIDLILWLSSTLSCTIRIRQLWSWFSGCCLSSGARELVDEQEPRCIHHITFPHTTHSYQQAYAASDLHNATSRCICQNVATVVDDV